MAESKPDQDESGEAGSQPKPLEPVKLIPMTGVRARIESSTRKAIQTTLPALGIAAGTGFAAGAIVENKYQDWTGYDPNDEAHTAEAEDAPDQEGQQWQSRPSGRNFLDRAKRHLGKARRWASKQVEESSIGRMYDDTVQELEEIKQMILATGNFIAFWIPFLLTALAMFIISKKILQLRHPHDPVVVENNRRIVEGLNGLIGRVNFLSTRPVPPGPVARDEFQRLADEIDRIKAGLGTHE